jgi:hypothetical protein
MAFRFRRSFRVLPGIRLNLSKSGISASLGIRGAHVTVGPRGTTTSVGLPGTGLSYTSHLPLSRNVHSPQPIEFTKPAEDPAGNQPATWPKALIFGAFFVLSFFVVFFFWH